MEVRVIRAAQAHVSHFAHIPAFTPTIFSTEIQCDRDRVEANHTPAPTDTADRWLGIEVVAAVIEQVGWVSRKESEATGKPATADFALDIVLANRVIGISEAARAKVVVALTWARQLKSEDRNLDSYELKLANLAAQPYISAADCGLAALMLVACDQAARHAVEARYPNRQSEPIGQIDERGTFTLEVVEVRPIGDGPEAKILHKFVDPLGNRAAWFASTGRALEVGQVYQIRGTVKAHRPYRDVMETILTRCQVQPATPDQAPLGI